MKEIKLWKLYFVGFLIPVIHYGYMYYVLNDYPVGGYNLYGLANCYAKTEGGVVAIIIGINIVLFFWFSNMVIWEKTLHFFLSTIFLILFCLLMTFIILGWR